MITQPGAAAWTVWRDSVVLDQQAGVEDLLQRPPLGLDIGRVHRPVRVVGVDPIAHASGQLGKRVDVPLHRLAGLGVERLDAVSLDLGLAIDAEFLLHSDLDRKTVAVPATLAADAVTLHAPEARKHVLEHPGLDVMGARHAIRGRWSFVEGPRRARGPFQDPLKCALPLPTVDDLVFHRDQVDLCRDLTIATVVLRLGSQSHVVSGFSHSGRSSDVSTCRRDEHQSRRLGRGTTLLGARRHPLNCCRGWFY